MTLRFEELIERHHDEIFAYLWRLMEMDRRRDGASDAEDLVQDVFLRAYQGFSRLRSNSNHRAWLYKIATNCAYTKLKQAQDRSAKVLSLQQIAAELPVAADSSASRRIMERSVRVLVRELPSKQRLCVTLRYLQDLDYPEIAQILGCSQQSVRANVYQAIRRLRVAIEEER